MKTGSTISGATRFPTRLPDALDDRLRAGLAAGIIDHDRRARRGQVLGNRSTDAFRRTRYNGDLAFKFLRHHDSFAY